MLIAPSLSVHDLAADDSFLIENTAGTVVERPGQYARVGALGSGWKFHGYGRGELDLDPRFRLPPIPNGE